MKTKISTVPTRNWLLIAGLLLLPPLGAAAQVLEAPAAFVPPSVQPREQIVPRLLFEATALEPAQRLPAARLVATAEIEAIGSWNAAGRQPQKTGFVRPLMRPLEVALDTGLERSSTGAEKQGLLQVSPSGGFWWVVRFEIDDARRLRLRLKSLDLPADATLLVYNEGGEAVSFGPELAGPDGDLWTPSVAGPVVFLEVHSPQSASRARFTIDALSERFELDFDGRPIFQPDSVPAFEAGRANTSCIVRSACVSNGTLSGIASYRAAVALLFFTRDGDEYICSASLLNDLDPSGFIPYLLTANHCFSTQSAASSLEAYWDYHASSCGGLVPNLGSVPRSNGGTLLASSSNSDFTFLRLNAAPTGNNGRTYLGWTSTPPNDGSSVYGLHHPLGEEQSYTRSVIDRTPAGGACGGAPTSKFIYASPVDGATFGGSSGSPITDSSLRVVGQLFGGCGPNANEPCNSGASDYDVFGAFATTKSSLSQWLDATGGGGGTPSCVDSPTTLCLLNKRFKLEATYRTAGGQTGPAQVVRLTEETGYFWFFNASNIEVVFKLLDACGSTLNNRFWVFAGGLTDVEVTTTVTDTAASGSGAVRTFFNPLSTPFQPIADTSAFATCP